MQALMTTYCLWLDDLVHKYNENSCDEWCICFAITSDSGVRNASAFLPDRLVPSITSMVVQTELFNIRQYKIIPDNPQQFGPAACAKMVGFGNFVSSILHM